ncbi:hypothetical protein FSPOR_605 [Fusarium sporotrichioides]|uniref:Uncharacterized protein n=1 Tax=Fusarium sporotrichioides TaxID=5514 RepID=A0A395STH4_FUSSP|nr:hypothetical protein FSPOR_605 [Fusarium sporotrichioides]
MLTNAARRQKTGRSSAKTMQFVANTDAQNFGFALTMTATNIAVTPTPNTVKATPRRTNARFQTALRIEVQNTFVKNTLVSILTALGRHWPRVGVKGNVVTISRVPHQGVPDMWRPGLCFVSSTSATSPPAIDPETFIMPMAPGSVTNTGVPSQNAKVPSSTPRVITSRGALDILANDRTVIKKPEPAVRDLLSVALTAAPPLIVGIRPRLKVVSVWMRHAQSPCAGCLRLVTETIVPNT